MSFPDTTNLILPHHAQKVNDGRWNKEGVTQKRCHASTPGANFYKVWAGGRKKKLRFPSNTVTASNTLLNVNFSSGSFHWRPYAQQSISETQRLPTVRPDRKLIKVQLEYKRINPLTPIQYTTIRLDPIIPNFKLLII